MKARFYVQWTVLLVVVSCVFTAVGLLASALVCALTDFGTAGDTVVVCTSVLLSTVVGSRVVSRIFD